MNALSWLARAALAVALLVPPERLPDVPLCAWRVWMGVRCPACGLSHALCALGHARWSDAQHYHPLAWPAALVVVVVAAWPLVRAIRASRRSSSCTRATRA